MSGTLRVGTERCAMLSEIAARRDWIVEGFMVLMAPIFGARRHSATERDGEQQKNLGDRQVSFAVQSRGHG